MLTFNIPLNSLSLTQSIFGVIRELYIRKIPILIFPIGQIDLSAFSIDQDFGIYIKNAVENAPLKFKKSFPVLKCWHLNGGIEGFGHNNSLLTFHETDQVTDFELAAIRANKKVFVTSKYTQSVMEEAGADNVVYLPLFFDKWTYSKKDAVYLDKDVLVFTLTGKLEKRKNTLEIIQSFAKKYGNDRKYRLHAIINNVFLKPEHQADMINRALEGKHYFNISIFNQRFNTNAEINDCVNAGFAELSGLSSAEAWNLPLFNSLCLGKHAPVLNATVHKDYCNDDNSILISPTFKEKAIDNQFFFDNSPFNSGNWDKVETEKFIWGMEQVAARFPNENIEGEKLKDIYTVEKTTDLLLENL